MKDYRRKCPKIGEVYLICFDGKGSVQRGWRPGLIIQNNVGNQYSPNVIALPLTSAIKHVDQPTHVYLPAKNTGLKIDSMVLCENPETVPKDMIKNYITDLPLEYMAAVAKAISRSMPLISFLSRNEMSQMWHELSYSGAR